MPFHLILSLSPDKILSKAFDQLELPHHFHFYDKKNYNEKRDDEKLNFQPSKDNRLIYNVFGSIDNEDSLILSYDDLFEFLQKILNNHSLPKTVRETIMDANCFVFVGFNYGKWYLKLLLRIMNLHEKVRKVYGMGTPSKKEIETFLVNEFDMNFTQMDTTSFVDELYENCKEAGILVSKENVVLPKVSDEISSSAKEAITDGKLEKALGILNNYCEFETPPEGFQSLFIQISSRFKRIKKENMEGVLRFDDYNIETNKVSRDLIALLKEFS